MLKPYLGFCQGDECSNKNKEVMVRGKNNPRCYVCAKKQFQSYGSKTKVRYRHKPSGESIIFELIWKQRDHNCVSCGKYLGEAAIPTFFSHIIRKSKREDLRLRPDNIVLECEQCHHNWDQGTIKDKVKSMHWNKKLEYIKKHEPALYEKLREQEQGLQKVPLFKSQV